MQKAFQYRDADPDEYERRNGVSLSGPPVRAVSWLEFSTAGCPPAF